MRKIIVRLDNPSGTEWTIEARDFILDKKVLVVYARSGKTWRFPLRHVIWWTDEPFDG